MCQIHISIAQILFVDLSSISRHSLRPHNKVGKWTYVILTYISLSLYLIPCLQQVPIQVAQLRKAIKEIQEICEKSHDRSQCFSAGIKYSTFQTANNTVLFTIFTSGTSGLKDSVRHFLPSSAEDATIGVQPATAKDLSKIVRLLHWYSPDRRYSPASSNSMVIPSQMKVLAKRPVQFAVRFWSHPSIILCILTSH